MVQCFAVFLILCISGGSLGTTTSPQQQNTAKLKDLCEVRRENYLTFQKIAHKSVPWERVPRDSLLSFKCRLFSHSFAIFNLHKLISYHINRKDTHIITRNTVNIFQLSTFLSPLHRLGIQTTVFRYHTFFITGYCALTKELKRRVGDY